MTPQHPGSILRSGAILALTLLAAGTASASDPYPWLTDLESARATAAAQKRPLLLVFRCEP